MIYLLLLEEVLCRYREGNKHMALLYSFVLVLYESRLGELELVNEDVSIVRLSVHN